jgi:hypothetical protein
MLDPKKQREHLRAYESALRHLELHEAAIRILENLSSPESAQARRALKRGQTRQLKLLDAAAAKLGAPYPARVDSSRGCEHD